MLLSAKTSYNKTSAVAQSKAHRGETAKQKSDKANESQLNQDKTLPTYPYWSELILWRLVPISLT